MSSERSDGTRSLIRSEAPPTAEQTVGQQLKGIREITGVLIDLSNLGTNSTANLETGNMDWAFRYEPDFVWRTSQGHVSVKDILTYPGTPLTDPLNRFWRDPEEARAGSALISSVIKPDVLELLDIPIGQLRDLWEFQQGIGSTVDIGFPTRRATYLAAGGHRKFKGEIKWGVIHQALSYPEAYEGANVLSHAVEVVVATRIPHLFYRFKFSGSLKNGLGNIEQGLTILPNVAYVDPGWPEWISKTRSQLSSRGGYPQLR